MARSHFAYRFRVYARCSMNIWFRMMLTNSLEKEVQVTLPLRYNLCFLKVKIHHCHHPPPYHHPHHHNHDQGVCHPREHTPICFSGVTQCLPNKGTHIDFLFHWLHFTLTAFFIDYIFHLLHSWKTVQNTNRYNSMTQCLPNKGTHIDFLFHWLHFTLTAFFIDYIFHLLHSWKTVQNTNRYNSMTQCLLNKGTHIDFLFQRLHFTLIISHLLHSKKTFKTQNSMTQGLPNKGRYITCWSLTTFHKNK